MKLVPVIAVGVLATFWLMKSIITAIQAVVNVVDTVTSWTDSSSHPGR